VKRDQHYLLREHSERLDQYQRLLEEDQALRHAEYDRPDPKRRRLRVACNECATPWCCNQRVDVGIVEALVLYRYAAQRAPRELDEAIARGAASRKRAPLDESAFFRRRLPCPFLVRGKCAVFPVRPHRCRTHYMAGNPQKCRDQLAPTETYEMSPDRSLLAELARVAEELRFDAWIEGAKPTELSEVMHLVDALATAPRWKQPTVLDWPLVDGNDS